MKPPVDRLMLGQARAEVAELRAEVERLRSAKLEREERFVGKHAELVAAESSLAEARALLERWLDCDGPAPSDATEAWLAANPESSRSETLRTAAVRSAERAVLDACAHSKITPDVIEQGRSRFVALSNNDIAEAELARRAVAEQLEPAPGFDAVHSAQIRDRMGPAPSDTVDELREWHAAELARRAVSK